MTEPNLEQLQFPIGKFAPPEQISPAERHPLIASLAQAPEKLRAAVAGLSDSQLATPYRDGGWTVRQVVHHLPDSHMNGYIRFKLALTENSPTINGYQQGAWASLQDSTSGSVELSLALLEALHARWLLVIRHMSDTDFTREYTVIDKPRGYRLDTALALYAWHSRHHVAQITSLRERMGW